MREAFQLSDLALEINPPSTCAVTYEGQDRQISIAGSVRITGRATWRDDEGQEKSVTIHHRFIAEYQFGRTNGTPVRVAQSSPLKCSVLLNPFTTGTYASRAGLAHEFPLAAGKSACICRLTDPTSTEGGGTSDAAMKFTGTG